MNTKLKTTTLAALTAAVILLAGCAPEAPAETAPGTPTATEAPAPETDQAPAVPEDLKTGDVVDAAAAEKLKEGFRNAAESDAVYTTAAGEHVLVRAGEPVPEAVVNDTAALTREAGKGTEAELTDPNLQPIGDAFETAEAQATSIGRSVAVISRFPSWSLETETFLPMWGSSLPIEEATLDIETQLAAAQKWVEKSPNTRYIVVVDLYL